MKNKRAITIIDNVDSAPSALKIKYASTTHVITREMISALMDGCALAFDSGDAAEFLVLDDE